METLLVDIGGVFGVRGFDGHMHTVDHAEHVREPGHTEELILGLLLGSLVPGEAWEKPQG